MSKFVEDGQLRWIVYSGILIGASALFRWDIGLYAGLSVVAAISLFYYKTRRMEGWHRLFLILFRPLSAFVVTSLLIILVSYGYFSIRSGFGELWAQLVVFPTTTFRSVRGLPYPPLFSPILPLTNNFY